ncbi:MAG: HDIG domain-containing protein [Lachnospiraceae bacterium]|nr:HDIG domain-containing protein [Lachnospiraceae bacterium]
MDIQELYHEINDILENDEQPSDKLEKLSSKAAFMEFPFSMLNSLKKTEQSKNYHPEGTAWVHTLMVVDEAAAIRHLSADPRVFMWGAFLHDIGKPETTAYRKGRITSYDHDRVGAELCKKFFEPFHESEEFVSQVTNLVRFHMHILYVNKELPFSKLNELRETGMEKEIALIGFADRMGRGGADLATEKAEIEKFYKIASSRNQKGKGKK